MRVLFRRKQTFVLLGLAGVCGIIFLALLRGSSEINKLEFSVFNRTHPVRQASEKMFGREDLNDLSWFLSPKVTVLQDTDRTMVMWSQRPSESIFQTLRLVKEATDLSVPPGQGEQSKYQVLPDLSSPTEGVQVTYATHASLPFLPNLVTLLKRWEGQVSVAVYAPGPDYVAVTQGIAALRACNPVDFRRVGFHLYWPKDQAPVRELLDWRIDFASSKVECSDVERLNQRFQKFQTKAPHDVEHPYMVNIGRNLARSRAKTDFVLVSDVELMPSLKMASRFLALWEREGQKLTQKHGPRLVFVPPIFEVDTSDKIKRRSPDGIPRDKKSLLKLVEARKAVYFHALVCEHCQRFPGLSEWLKSPGKEDELTVFDVVERKAPFDRWEPLYISHRSAEVPLYEERLSWQGAQEKMNQVYEMCRLGFKFAILNEAFLAHVPGIKRSKLKEDREWRGPFMDANAHVVKDLMRGYIQKYGKDTPGQGCLNSTAKYGF